jgi:hypothetical protein
MILVSWLNGREGGKCKQPFTDRDLAERSVDTLAQKGIKAEIKDVEKW